MRMMNSNFNVCNLNTKYKMDTLQLMESEKEIFFFSQWPHESLEVYNKNERTMKLFP